MPDDLRITGRGDDQRINVRQDHEVTYWTYELNCTAEELRQAVKEVGPSVRDIRAVLQKKATDRKAVKAAGRTA